MGSSASVALEGPAGCFGSLAFIPRSRKEEEELVGEKFAGAESSATRIGESEDVFERLPSLRSLNPAATTPSRLPAVRDRGGCQVSSLEDGGDRSLPVPIAGCPEVVDFG